MTDDSDERQLVLRPLERGDFDLLKRWLSRPHVLPWWGEPLSAEEVRSKFEPRIAVDSVTRVFIADLDGQPVGMIQCYRHADHPVWDTTIGAPLAAGIDYLIGESGSTGKGLGTAMIKQVTDIAFGLYDDIDKIISVPQAANLASRKALVKAGFELQKECQLDSDDPRDAGISAIYVLNRKPVPTD